MEKVTFTSKFFQKVFFFSISRTKRDFPALFTKNEDLRSAPFKNKEKQKQTRKNRFLLCTQLVFISFSWFFLVKLENLRLSHDVTKITHGTTKITHGVAVEFSREFENISRRYNNNSRHYENNSRRCCKIL